jgi:hypothetical protein
LLQAFHPLRGWGTIEDSPRFDSILFFIQCMDDFGDRINIFEKFFDCPPCPGSPGGLLTNQEFEHQLLKRKQWTQRQRLNSKNYLTIVDFANRYLDKDKEEQNEIITALNVRLAEIIKFRKTMQNVLQDWILPDVANIIFDYAFVSIV